MSKQSKKPDGNPYKVLWWLGGALVLLFAGVAALIAFMPKDSEEPPDPQRILLWLYDDGNRGGPAAVAVIEESRSARTLKAVVFPAPDSARELFAQGRASSARGAHYEVARLLDRQIHHRVFLPHSVVAAIADAAGGIELDGTAMTGSEAVAYIAEGGEETPTRAVQVMLAMADAAARNGVSMGVSEGLALARKVQTDMDLMAFPNVLSRWTGYGNPEIIPVAAAGPEAASHLTPDPEGE